MTSPGGNSSEVNVYCSPVQNWDEFVNAWRDDKPIEQIEMALKSYWEKL